MSISNNIHDRDKAAYKENTLDGGLDRRVTDITSQAKLDAIAAALGSPTNTTVTIFNVSVLLSGTEVSQALPTNTKGFILRARNKSEVKIAYNSGDSGALYLTLKPGTVYTDENFYTNQTIYFQTSQNGEIIEILAYS